METIFYHTLVQQSKCHETRQIYSSTLSKQTHLATFSLHQETSTRSHPETSLMLNGLSSWKHFHEDPYISQVLKYLFYVWSSRSFH